MFTMENPLDRDYNAIMDRQKIKQVLAEIDLANSEVPKELAYSVRLKEWVERLSESPSDALRIAACGQHIRRWRIPRDSYEMTRTGYLKWRAALKVFHAEEVGKIMARVGCDPQEIESVRSLVLKRRSAGDVEAQILEDALCLVFLETQFKELRQKTEPKKFAEIVRKTWAKMGVGGKAAALALDMDPDDREFILAALG